LLKLQRKNSNSVTLPRFVRPTKDPAKISQKARNSPEMKKRKTLLLEEAERAAVNVPRRKRQWSSLMESV
jgi:hypothetical protein